MSSSRLSWLFSVLNAENYAMMVGIVVLTTEELSIVEGSFLGLEVIALFRMVEADEAWQQHLRSRAE